MAKRHVVDTVRMVLTGWAPASGSKPAILFPNPENAPPEPPEPYIAVQFPVANAERTTHSRSYVEEGAARIVILAARATGEVWALDLGEEIAALFRSLKTNGVEFLTPVSTVLNDNNDNGNYFRTSIVVPYLYHFDDPE